MTCEPVGRSFALLPSPLCGPSTWRPVCDLLDGRAVVLDTAGAAPGWRAEVDAAVVALAAHGEVVLVGHSGAGPLLAEIAARAASVAQLVFVDAGLPANGSRMEALRREGPDAAAQLEDALAVHGRYPSWTADDLRELVPDDAVRARFVAELRPRERAFFTEQLPAPKAGWGHSAAYLQLSPSYRTAADEAERLGLPTRRLHGTHHLSMLADPGRIAKELIDRIHGPITSASVVGTDAPAVGNQGT